MSKTIVQIRFKLEVSAQEYEQAVRPLAPQFVDCPGLEWKIWLLNEEAGEAGGVYLFADEGAAQSFLDGPMVAQVKSAPILSGFSATRTGVMAELSAVTRAPLTAYAHEA
jgi:hypothetical protein